MIRPLDMQVNFNAVPEVARQTTSHDASIQYKQVAALGQARVENLARPESVVEVAGRSASQFRTIQNDENRVFASRRPRGSRDEKADEPLRLYEPVGYSRKVGRRSDLPSGSMFDAVA